MSRGGRWLAEVRKYFVLLGMEVRFFKKGFVFLLEMKVRFFRDRGEERFVFLDGMSFFR